MAAHVRNAGFGKLALIIVGLLFLAVGTGVLVRSGKVNVDISRLLPLPAVASAKDFDFVTDDHVKRHFVAQANARAFRTISGTGEGDAAVTIQTDYERTRSDVRVRLVQKTKDTIISEAVFWDNDIFVKDPTDSKWWQQQVTPEVKKQSGFVQKDYKTELLAKKGSVYESQGEEACGSLTCYKYVESAPGNALAKRIFWFDKDKLLLRRDDLSFGGLITTQTYEYDNINVEKPTQVKNIAEGANIVDYLLTGGVSLQIGTTASGSSQLNADSVAEQLRADLRKQLQDQLQQELKDQLQKQLQDQLKQQLNELPEVEIPTSTVTESLSATPTP